ncbi:unnamed protein product [Notodromas monacha]|uniref:Uncharacterized protein n=1 Tax=Notodromas monacha TaxID=399045 RepID=A0A7R9BRS9_9CRUS|nr:unnamed protein product [Notodromas monacha]CAG0919428.1 unnamed protein product [Notodromas monacha]
MVMTMACPKKSVCTQTLECVGCAKSLEFIKFLMTNRPLECHFSKMINVIFVTESSLQACARCEKVSVLCTELTNAENRAYDVELHKLSEEMSTFLKVTRDDDAVIYDLKVEYVETEDEEFRSEGTVPSFEPLRHPSASSAKCQNESISNGSQSRKRKCVEEASERETNAKLAKTPAEVSCAGWAKLNPASEDPDDADVLPFFSTLRI